MKICCGAVPTKTPLLNSEITHMQVNPDWIIPLSIVKGEVAVHGGDSAYFAKRRYYIIDRQKGDTLDPKKVSSSQLTGGGLRVGQKGGAGNSLGRIVFRFANNFGVYLHDTNNRGAFKRERRTLSHGCVRVEKPFELACFLLQGADEWTLDKIRLSMDMKPETERGLEYLEEHAEDPRPLKAIVYRDINPRVPVYIILARPLWLRPGRSKEDETILVAVITMEKFEDQQIRQMLLDPKTQRQGFEACVRQYSEQLYWQVRKIVLTHDDADDVVQNTFLKAWNALDNFGGDSKVITWLSRIAINEALDLLRKNKLRLTVSDELPSVASSLLADPYFDGSETEKISDFFKARD